MKQLTFSVADQTLRRTDKTRVVGDTVGQFEATFTFNDWWDGYTATAQFTKDGLTYDALIVDGVCAVPDEVIAGNGNMYVNVFSTDGDGNRKTVNEVAICVYASGLKTASATHAGPVITIWNVVLALLNKFSGGTAGQFLRKKSADSYDGEWVSLLIDADTEYRTAAEVDAAVAGITAELTDKEDTANKVTSIDGDSTDEQYPSAKCLYDTIAGVAPKMQKYTINAEEYYDKTSKTIIEHKVRTGANGTFDVTLAVSVKLVSDVFDNPTPVFANQPISYGDDMCLYADLKEIVLCFEDEIENPDTGEMELEEFYMSASFFVSLLSDCGYIATIKLEVDDHDYLSATIYARYEGIGNDAYVEIERIAENFNELLKTATLCYVPYEKGDETIAEVSI